MTIQDIVKRLKDCAAGKCKDCPHQNVFDCEAFLIDELAKECEKIKLPEEDQ